MAEFIDVQTDFAWGQFDTKMHASVEFKDYRKGLRVLENMLVTSEAGLKKRFGLQFSINMKTVEGNITKDNVRIEILQTTPTQKLLVVFSPERINLLEPQIDGSLKNIFSDATLYTTPQIKEITFAQSGGVLLIFHEDVNPTRLSIKPPPDPPHPNGIWQFTVVPFKSVPTFGFQEDKINDFVFEVTLGDSIGRTKILKILTGQAFFTDDFIGGIFVAEGGVFQIDGPVGGIPLGSEITGTVIAVFDKKLKTNIPGKEAFISQQAISSTRGWPRAGTFFSSRLWLLGAKAIPNAVFGSAVQDFFAFTSGRQNDGDPIDDILQGESLTFINEGVGNKTLIVFTNEGPYATQLPFESALSPTNTSFALEGSQSIGNLPPVTLDNKVLFINEGGKILWGMSYNNDIRGYSIVNLSITASELLNNPVSHAVFKGDPLSNASYELIVNSDGSIAALTSNTESSINAWSRLLTLGTFEGVFSLGNFAYVLVQRNNELLLEKIDFTKVMDSFVEKNFNTAAIIIPGLDHLEGLIVEVIADGILLPVVKTNPGQPGSSVVKNGQIRLLKPAKDVIVGLDYAIKVIPLPVNVNTDVGNDLYEKKTTASVFVSYFESLGIEVNGEQLPGQEFSENFENALELKTGQDSVQVSTGYEPFVVDVEITQARPLPVYIRAISRKVEI